MSKKAVNEWPFVLGMTFVLGGAAAIHPGLLFILMGVHLVVCYIHNERKREEGKND